MKYIDSLVDLIQTNIDAVPSETPVSSVRQVTNAFATSSIFGEGRGKVGEATKKHFGVIKAGIDLRFGRADRGGVVPIINEWTD